MSLRPEQLDEAAAALGSIVSELRSAIAAKGYPKGMAEIEIHGPGRVRIWLRTGSATLDGPRAFKPAYGGTTSYAACDGASFSEAHAKALEAIAQMIVQPKAEDYAPWFTVETTEAA
jgi:hypothetical protein